MTRVAAVRAKWGPALDPCGAIQVPFELADGQEREIIFRLGVGRDADDARNLVHRFRGSAAARELRSKRCGSTGSTPLAPCMWRHPTSL